MRISTILVALATTATTATLARPALAETSVFLENRSGRALCVRGTTMRGGLASWAWRQPDWDDPPTGSAFQVPGCRYRLGPGARIEALRMNDDQGVTHGKTFYFETTLASPAGGEATLSHALEGEWVGSDLARRVDDAPWVSDDRTRRHAWHVGDGVHLIESGEDGGDLYYRVGPRLPEPAPAPGRGPGEVSLLTWNLGRIPGSGAGRTYQQVELLEGYDVLVLTEVFLEDSKRILKRTLEPRYPYRTTGLGDDGLVSQDGGVMIFSRWPIEHQDELVFRGGRGTDRLAGKGGLYARIRAPFGTMHVVGTHAQSSADDMESALVEAAVGPSLLGPAAIRASQFHQLAEFLRRKRIPASEPVLIAGDLNVVRGDRREYATMREILGVVALEGDLASPTWDPTNTEVDDDASPERLDYVLAGRENRRPAASQVQVLRLRDRRGADLSDHHAVHAWLDFSARRPPPPAAAAFPPRPAGSLFGLGGE